MSAPCLKGHQSTYVVNESGIRHKIMDCVEVRPVGCFYEGENMMVIHPDDASIAGLRAGMPGVGPLEIATSSFQLAGLGAGDGRHEEQAQ